MKKFVIKCILFLLFLLIYMGGNYIVNTHYINSIIPEVKLDNCKTLIAGDSHMKRALDPSFFDSAINISQNAEPYFITYWKLKKLLTINNTVNTLLLGFSFHNISAFNDRKLNDQRWSHEMFKRIYPIEELNTLKDIEIDWPGYYTILIKKMCFYPIKKHGNYIGEYNNSYKINVSDYNIRINTHYYYNNRNVGISEVAIDFLKSIITLCKKNQIKIVLIATPLHEKYFKRIPANFKQKFLHLKNKLKNNDIIILDYSNVAFDNNAFVSSDHLNARGAQRFTKMVIDSLQHY